MFEGGGMDMTPEEITVKLTETEARSKSNTHRLDAVEARQDALDKLTESMARMDERQGHMDTDVKEIKSDVKSLTDKPAERWDTIVEILLGVVVGAFAAWLLGGAVG